MTFNKLNFRAECQCLDGAKVDTENKFCRRIPKDTFTEKEFKTHSERGIGNDSTNCEEICSYSGLSLNLFKPEFEELIINKYKTTFSFNPKKGAYYLKFKLKEDAGVVKYAPELDDESHHNFYKSDSFTLESLEELETIKIV